MTFVPQYIVIHHSATDRRASIDDIRNYHLGQGMDDIAYHYLIDDSGAVLDGRPLEVMGAHARGLNAESLGVCCIGDYRHESPPMKMIIALQNVVMRLQYMFSIPSANIIGHRDVIRINPEATKTECPGDGLYSYLRYLRNN